MKALLFISICTLVSCGTSKRSTETERRTSVDVAISDSAIWRDTATRTEWLLSNEMLNAHIIITELSKPDSAGRQYPTKTTEIDLSQEKGEVTAKSDKSGSEATQVKKGDTAIREDENKKEDVKTDTRIIPTWVWWFLGVGGVIAALLYWRSRKKE